MKSFQAYPPTADSIPEPPPSPRYAARSASFRKGVCQILGLSIFLIAALLTGTQSFAQSVELTSEQRAMLNQLPASQREAVLRQLQTLSDGNSALQPVQQQTPTVPQPAATVDPSVIDALLLSAEERFEPEDTLLIRITGGLATANPEMLGWIRANNPYQLDALGRLSVPGVGEVNLSGLTEAEAEQRLAAERELQGLQFDVVRLPLRPVGVDALEPFGYSLFSSGRTQNWSAAASPVPEDYTLGPGDSLRIQLFGNVNSAYELLVERDGTILFPDLGPLVVAGMRYSEARDFIQQRVGTQLIGTDTSISMGQLRSVQVFLVGDVNSPGAYAVSALSTITGVLSAGGGVAESGSLRRIELKRDGEVVARLDTYDLLLEGDSRDDVRVRAGDVVFVPPVGPTVSIAGEVKRPAIYEYAGNASAADLVAIAGGLTSDALPEEARISRRTAELGFSTIEVDLSGAAGSATRVSDGDVLEVPSVGNYDSNSVELLGNVTNPGRFQWRDGLRLSNLISDPTRVRGGSDLEYVLIQRRATPNAQSQFLSADLEAAWVSRGSPIDLPLERGDRVFVLDIVAGRARFVDPLVEELSLRAKSDAPLPVVRVGGSVNSSGQYPLESGMRVSDLLRAGGGLSQSAFTGPAELTRYEVRNGVRTSRIELVDIGAILAGDDGADLRLQSFDYLNVRETPQWRDEEFIELVGEVRFPGRYSIQTGETLASVIDRAGGLNGFAYPSGSVFTRVELRQREQEQLEELASRIESDLASMPVDTDANSVSTGQSLLRQLRQSRPAGRLVIDLDRIIAGDASSDVMLTDGDVLRVPRRPQSVTVIGEVQYSTSHIYSEGLRRDDYINRSGGVTIKADRRRIYVVRASGQVLADEGSRLFGRASRVDIQPGDTIVVPLDTERVSGLTFWTGVTQILYNTAIAVAAIDSITN